MLHGEVHLVEIFILIAVHMDDINLPTGFAGSLYSQIYVNLPVVVYR